MPEMNVRGVALNYRIVGNFGPLIALTPGSRRPFGELVGIAERLAQGGYRVLLHDRRNCGASQIAIEGSGSEHEIWADDLAALCEGLGAPSAYVGGSSAGARLAILVAIRRPRMVKGLLLWRVTGGASATEKLAKQYYGDFIDLAQAGGMEAIARSEHFAECIAARPDNKARLMAIPQRDFIAVMEFWRRRFLADADLPVVGASEAQLRAIKAPVCMIAGNDQIHPPMAARRAKSLLPDAELHDDVVERRADDDLLVTWDQADWRAKEPRVANIFLDFLSRVERRDGAMR